MSDAELAAELRRREIDIAVDLNGYTAGQRVGAFVHRPCPVQATFLGYPGTLGGAFVDYMIADAIVVPSTSARFYTEQTARLPHTFMVTDATQAIAPATPTRAAHGLPAEGFVFACFAGASKISPHMFKTWMNLLRRVDGSVLWLRVGESVAHNLRREACAAGIDPARMVIAPRVALPEQLARHRCADLFLDTFPYNAHSTAVHALWAGLPVLTLQGEAFAGRVGASLLQSADLPELIAHTAEDYEAHAAALAQAPERLAALRARLARHLATAPLFDTEGFARNIERAYRHMLERAQAGQPPAAFTLDEGRG